MVFRLKHVQVFFLLFAALFYAPSIVLVMRKPVSDCDNAVEEAQLTNWLDLFQFDDIDLSPDLRQGPLPLTINISYLSEAEQCDGVSGQKPPIYGCPYHKHEQ